MAREAGEKGSRQHPACHLAHRLRVARWPLQRAQCSHQPRLWAGVTGHKDGTCVAPVSTVGQCLPHLDWSGWSHQQGGNHQGQAFGALNSLWCSTKHAATEPPRGEWCRLPSASAVSFSEPFHLIESSLLLPRWCAGFHYHSDKKWFL